MIRLGICNELFEGWDFARSAATVKALGYDGLEIAPFTLAPRITDSRRGPPPRAPRHGRGRRAENHRPALAAGEDRGLLLDLTRREVRRRTGDYLVALAEATPRPGRLAHGLGLAQAARPTARRQPEAGDGPCGRGLPPRHARPSAKWASISASSRWPPARPTS